MSTEYQNEEIELGDGPVRGNVVPGQMTSEDELIMGVYTIPDILTPPDVNR